jgi:hypothetical protein
MRGAGEATGVRVAFEMQEARFGGFLFALRVPSEPLNSALALEQRVWSWRTRTFRWRADRLPAREGLQDDHGRAAVRADEAGSVAVDPVVGVLAVIGAVLGWPRSLRANARLALRLPLASNP